MYCATNSRSVQVRRSDKLIKEAKFHGLEEYMFHVQQYYEYLETRQTVDRRRIYIATDDPQLLKQAKEKYVQFYRLLENFMLTPQLNLC